MIDTHCHLLPGLDDGPETPAEALLLAERLLASGVTAVLCTTHFSRDFPTSWGAVLAGVATLSRELAEARVPLMLIPSAEVSPVFAVTQPLEALHMRSIGGRHLVVEALLDSPELFFHSVIERLASTGLRPIYAHPERAQSVQRRPGLLDGVREAGALVQVLAPSLLGRWGQSAARCAWSLVENGTADLLGSDAHGVRRRRVHLAEAAGAVARRYGPRRAEELTVLAPQELIGERVPG